jgi:methionyl-tRNA formyltransferase
MLKKEEGWVDWNRAAADVVNHIRGMDPWPGAFCWRGEHQRVKLFRASPSLEATELAPGTVAFVDERGVHVACSDGMVCVGMLQPQGGRKMSAKDYAAGHPFAAHEQFAAGAPS